MLLLAFAHLALTPPLRLPTRHGAAASPRAAVACKLNNKQQDLAAMMAKAKAARTGEAVEQIANKAPPPKSKAKAPIKKPSPPPKAKGAASRDDLFSMMQNAQVQQVQTQVIKQRTKYGEEKPTRPAPVAMPAPQDAPAIAKPPPPSAEDYAAFKQALGGSVGARGEIRSVSDEVLTKGSQLPLPSVGLVELDGVPASYASLEAIAGDRALLVLLASVDAILADRWRSVLTAFHGQADFGQYDAQVAAVSRTPCSTYRKLARKAGVSYPLLSDPSSAWLGPLRCAPDAVVAIVVDASTSTVVGSYRGATSDDLLQRVVSGLKQRRDGGGSAAGQATAEVSTLGVEQSQVEAMWAQAEADMDSMGGGVSDDAALEAAAAAWADADAADAAAEAEAAALQAENEKLRRALLDAQQQQDTGQATQAAEAEREKAARAQAQREASQRQADAQRANAQQAAAERAAELSEREAKERVEKAAAAAEAQVQKAAEQAAREAAKAATRAAEGDATKAAKAAQLQLAALQKQLDVAQAQQKEEARARAAAEAAAAGQLAALAAAETAAKEAAAAAQLAAEAAMAESVARQSIELQMAEATAAEAAREAAAQAAAQAAAAAKQARLESIGATFVPDPALEDEWKSMLNSNGGGRGGRPPPQQPPQQRNGDRRAPQPREGRGGAAAARSAQGGRVNNNNEEGYKFVYLPGLFQVARLLNNTAGVQAVGSSRIRKSPPPTLTLVTDEGGGRRLVADGDDDGVEAEEEGGGEGDGEALVELIADAAGAADAAAAAEATDDSTRLRVGLQGMSRGAHQLYCRGGRRWQGKTQLLFVTLEENFTREKLVEKLRALELVLDFELVVE